MNYSNDKENQVFEPADPNVKKEGEFIVHPRHQEGVNDEHYIPIKKESKFPSTTSFSKHSKWLRIIGIFILVLIFAFEVVRPFISNLSKSAKTIPKENSEPNKETVNKNLATPTIDPSKVLIIPPSGQNPTGSQPLPPATDQGTTNITLSQEASVPTMDLRYIPDGHIAKLENNKQITLFISALDRNYIMRGTSLDNLKLLTDSRNQPLAVLQPSTGVAYEKDYAAVGSIIFNKYTGDFIGIYHTEARLNKDASDTQTTSIALALSRDGGMTWSKKGQIITGENILPIGQKVSGAGQPSAIVIGDYMYLYFSDWNGKSTDAIHLARAPLKSNGLPGSWMKYTKSGFNSPGLGGRSDPVILPPTNQTVYTSNPSISYNNYFKKYLAIFETNLGFFIGLSSDAINWGSYQQFFTFPKDTTLQKVNGDIWYSYPSFISQGTPTDMETSKSGYLYYSRGIFGQYHLMVKRALTFK